MAAWRWQMFERSVAHPWSHLHVLTPASRTDGFPQAICLRHEREVSPSLSLQRTGSWMKYVFPRPCYTLYTIQTFNTQPLSKEMRGKSR